jgi:RimJ/RimL family protein N-acetyltransferase
MKFIVETERLWLREIYPEDDAGLFELDSNPEVHRYLGNNPVSNIEQIRQVIQYIRQQYLDNGIGRWAIIEKNTNHFVGWTGLKLVRDKVNNHQNYYDLGYRLIQKYWGLGYATESARASLDYGFHQLNIPVIYAAADSGNLASKNVLRKMGFRHVEFFEQDGILTDWLELTKPEWLTINSR